MKKYVFDFIVALAALIFALVLGIIVLKIAIDRKGDFFYKNTNQTQTSTTDTTKKKTNTNLDNRKNMVIVFSSFLDRFFIDLHHFYFTIFPIK